MYTPRQARRLADKTQQEVADFLGIHVCTYKQWEASPARFNVSNGKKFAECVNVPFDDISFDQDSTKRG